MAKAKRASWLTRCVSHRFLLGIEVVLIVGIASELFGNWVKGIPSMPNYGKALFTMAGVVGAFSALFAGVNAMAAFGVGATHKAVNALPVPLPGLLVHLAALCGLFLLYAWVWGYWPLW